MKIIKIINKVKILIIIILLFVFFLSTYAVMCFPVAQVYLNKKTGKEKFLPNKDILNNFTSPLSTQSFIKSEEVFNFGIKDCGGREIKNLQKLTFGDFSFFDKIKILMNGIIKIVIPPTIIFSIFVVIILVHHHTKSLVLRVLLDMILFIVILILLFIFRGFYLVLV